MQRVQKDDDPSEKVYSLRDLGRIFLGATPMQSPAPPMHAPPPTNASVPASRHGAPIPQHPGFWSVALFAAYLVFQWVRPGMEQLQDGLEEISVSVDNMQEDVSDVKDTVGRLENTVNKLEGASASHAVAIKNHAEELKALRSELAFQDRLLRNAKVNLGLLEALLENITGKKVTLQPEPTRERLPD